MSHYRYEERSGHVKKRMQQLITVNSTLILSTCMHVSRGDKEHRNA